MRIDSHAHITEPRLVGEIPRIAGEMKNDGLYAIIEAGCDYDTSLQAAKLARQFENIYALAGTHPEFAAEYSQREEELYRELSSDPKVVGIGEIGLDYYYETPLRDVQKRAFVAQLRLAHEVGLPVSLHIRDAYGDLLEILKDNASLVKNGLLMHCYCGSKEFVRELAKYDAYFAFGGVVTFKNAKKDEIIKAVPKDRLLIETDCPYMTPVPLRGKLNEPKNTVYTAQYIADVLEMPLCEFDALTIKNTKDLFTRIK